MSTSKHTSAPWRHLKQTNCPDSDASLDRRLGIYAEGDEGRGGSFVAVVEGDMFESEEEEANARLIASSPDLLSELQTEETWIANLIGDCEASRLLKPEVIAENLRARLKSIRETITKATTN